MSVKPLNEGVCRRVMERGRCMAAEEWIPMTLVALTTVGMLLASPVWASPDAPMQQITAWHDIHHLLPSSNTLVPLAGSIIPCFAHHAALAASCTMRHPVPLPQDLNIPTLNYPPLGFWVIGLGQILGSTLSATAVSTMGRLLLALCCLLIVMSAGRVVVAANQRSALWMLPIAVTPMAAFLFAGSNVNGLEISCAVLFVALLYRWRHQMNAVRMRTDLAVGVGALALAACKPGDGVWIILLVGAALIRWRHCVSRRAIRHLVVACAPAVVASGLWSLAHPTVITLAGVKHFHPGGPLSWPTRFARSIAQLPNVAMQAWGVVGWLDTTPGRRFFVVLGIATAWFLQRTITSLRDRLFLGASVLLVAGTAVLGDAILWRNWPFWWQGRYSLPLIVGLALLLVDDAAARPRPGMRAWAGFSSIASALMILLVDMRFAAGLTRPFEPVTVEPMLHDPIRTAAVVLIVLLQLVVGFWLLWSDRQQPRWIPLVRSVLTGSSQAAPSHDS